MSDSFRIRRATYDAAETEGLADVLIDVVEGGASVGLDAPRMQICPSARHA